jgi:hypothetical protein
MAGSAGRPLPLLFLVATHQEGACVAKKMQPAFSLRVALFFIFFFNFIYFFIAFFLFFLFFYLFFYGCKAL